MSDSLWTHGLQHSTLPYPSLFPLVCSNSCPLSQWCYLTILPSAAPFSFYPQSFPASGSFPMSQLHIRWPKYRTSASVSVLLMNILGWFPLGLTGWISLQSKGLSRVFSNTIVQKHQFFGAQLSYPYMTTEKTIALTRWTFLGKVMSLLFNMLSRFVITFLPRSKCLLICGCSHHLPWFWRPKK